MFITPYCPYCCCCFIYLDLLLTSCYCLWNKHLDVARVCRFTGYRFPLFLLEQGLLRTRLLVLRNHSYTSGKDT